MNELQLDTTSAVVFLMSLLMAGFLWWTKRHIERSEKRIENIEANYLTSKTLEKMQLERQEMHRENGDKLNKIDANLNDLSKYVTAPLAVLKQRVDEVEERVQELRDWKHDKCEPSVRYVDYLQKDKPWERK